MLDEIRPEANENRTSTLYHQAIQVLEWRHVLAITRDSGCTKKVARSTNTELALSLLPAVASAQ